MYVCMYVCMYVWMDGWMDGWMDVCMCKAHSDASLVCPGCLWLGYALTFVVGLGFFLGRCLLIQPLLAKRPWIAQVLRGGFRAVERSEAHLTFQSTACLYARLGMPPFS